MHRIVLASLLAAQVLPGQAPVVPRISREWWQVAGNPDLGKLRTTKQQPVDFAIWQAADGTWQLWSCIRATAAPGRTRLFHRWQGKSLTDSNWEPMGIAMQADPGFGETPGGLQAPHVVRVGHLRRGGGNNARDIMLIRIGDLWHGYYTAFPGRKGAVYVRTSKDLREWSASKIVAAGGEAGDGPFSAECPFVWFHEPSGYYFLFRTQRYGKDAETRVYGSRNPMDFGVNDDRYLVTKLSVAAPEIIEHNGELFIATLLPGLDGIRIARLTWEKR